jgi:hypothetical protein
VRIKNILQEQRTQVFWRAAKQLGPWAVTTVDPAEFLCAPSFRLELPDDSQHGWKLLMEA